jgi:hypothetical protein
MLIINDDYLVNEELLLHNNDYPSNYINKAHKNDYKIFKEPNMIEKIFNKISHHNRLLLRISWKINDNQYVPMTFVCDTGAPMNFYVSELGKVFIKSRINEDELQTEYVIIKNKNGNTKKVSISPSPNLHSESNIIGLLLLDFFGLTIKNGQFDLEYIPKYL